MKQTSFNKKNASPIGLDHLLVGATSPKYELLHFLTTVNFLQTEEGTSF